MFHEMIVGLQYRGLNLTIRARLDDIRSELALSVTPTVQVVHPVGASLYAQDYKITAAAVRSAVERVLQEDAIKVLALRRGRSLDLGIPLLTEGRGQSSQLRSENDCLQQRPRARDLATSMFSTNPTTIELRPFQRAGCAWLLRNRRAILADDMGLGKTIQAIYAASQLIVHNIVSGIVILSPNTLLANWQAEFSRWAPKLHTAQFRPQSGEQQSLWKCACKRYHVLFLNYEQLRLSIPFMGKLSDHLLIADEAHRLRNAGAQVTQAVRELDPGYFWALTGTPIERDKEDLATLLSVILPNRFKPSDKMLAPSALRSMANPYVLRRRKSEVLRDLPEVIENVEWVDLTDQQQETYKRALERPVANDAGSVLRIIGTLRRICDVDQKTGKSSKVDRTEEIIRDVADSNEKVVVFSFYRKPLELLEERLASPGTIPIWTRRVDGRTSHEVRATVLEEFSRRSGAAALLLSGHVGGEGLTLTAANNVVFLNQWWNPSKNAQARDRVVRIGQNKCVVVWYLTCRNTIEEQVQRVLVEKSGTFDKIVEGLSRTLKLDREGTETLRTYVRSH